MSGKFQDKLTGLKQTIAMSDFKNTENLQQNCANHTCSNVQIKIDEGTNSKMTRNDLCIQQPIIIQKKNAPQSKPSSAKK